MDSLREWYRYLDSVSRPARRRTGGEGAAPERPWRPWEDEPSGESIRLEEVPDLADRLAPSGLAQARHAATRDFEDPTLYDELRPIPEFTVPALRPPAFAIDVPALRGASASAPPPSAPHPGASADATAGGAPADEPQGAGQDDRPAAVA